LFQIVEVAAERNCGKTLGGLCAAVRQQHSRHAVLLKRAADAVATS
jgi:hypothetical protein